MLPEYLNAIRVAGGIPVVLPLVAEGEDVARLAASFDGFLFTGGQDVSPALYGEPDRTGLSVPSPERDALEAPLLQEVLKADKPVLGICRGLQFLNAAMGGDLWQDLPSEHPSDIVHRQGKPYDKAVHTVRLEGPLKDLLGKSELSVNSLHHQAIRKLAPGWIPEASSPDGLRHTQCTGTHKSEGPCRRISGKTHRVVVTRRLSDAGSGTCEGTGGRHL